MGVFFPLSYILYILKAFSQKTLWFCLIFLLYSVTSDLAFGPPACSLLKSAGKGCVLTSHPNLMQLPLLSAALHLENECLDEFTYVGLAA